NFAHVAILAGNALLAGCRRMLVFAEGVFQSKPVGGEYVVTRSTEARRRDLKESLGRMMHVPPANVGIGVRLQDAVFLGIVQNLPQSFAAQWSEDGLMDISRDERLSAAAFAPGLVDPVANDARHALSRSRQAVHLAHVDRLFERHA